MIFRLTLQRQRQPQRQSEKPKKSGKFAGRKCTSFSAILLAILGRYKFRKCGELLPEWNGLAKNVLYILLEIPFNYFCLMD